MSRTLGAYIEISLIHCGNIVYYYICHVIKQVVPFRKKTRELFTADDISEHRGGRVSGVVKKNEKYSLVHLEFLWLQESDK
jgi:hypothetical protein